MLSTTFDTGMRLRLAGFLLAIAVLLSLIVWAAVTSWRRVEESRAQLSSVQSESFRIASHLQQSILDLNQHLLNFAVQYDTNALTEFETKWVALGRWIDEQHLSAPEEKPVLEEINAAYDRYHSTAMQLAAKVASRTNGGVAAAELAQFQQHVAHLLNLSYQLAEAHRQSLAASLAGSNNALAHLHSLLLGALFLLVALGSGMAVVVYRQLIAPLRLKLVESQALLERQEKLASLGVLAAGVAHEVRNPLTAIKAWLFMRQRAMQPGTEEHADSEVISKEIERLERIVKDFLLFARPSDPQLETVPADRPLREVQQLLAVPLEKSNIQVVVENRASARINIDPQQIKQVLINLVQNAAESIGQNGVITLRTRLERNRLLDSNGEAVVLEVADNGKGMPPEVEKRLFDPFFTTKETGTGLGLPIAARIVEKHGGALEYKTQVNHGTTFGIVLPQVRQ